MNFMKMRPKLMMEKLRITSLSWQELIQICLEFPFALLMVKDILLGMFLSHLRYNLDGKIILIGYLLISEVEVLIYYVYFFGIVTFNKNQFIFLANL